MSAVHVTVNGVLVRRNNSQQEDFVEASEPVGLISEGLRIKGAILTNFRIFLSFVIFLWQSPRPWT